MDIIKPCVAVYTCHPGTRESEAVFRFDNSAVRIVVGIGSLPESEDRTLG